jgi:predicted metal-dependent HD superfamily phosphohydrolase
VDFDEMHLECGQVEADMWTVVTHPDTDRHDNVAHSGVFAGAALAVAAEASMDPSRHEY